ncbi:flotillin-2-like [Lycorma delicatula]|uniref:flotillin-2-like n=1 Tax=Lycorma delicatula TaxID=130591 RepID=UPI003F50DE0D
MGKIYTVGPNKAVVIAGGTRRTNKKIKVAGSIYCPSYLAKASLLSLNLMTLNPVCYDVETVQGVPLNVSAIAQCKIMNSPEFLLIAAEQFLGKPHHEIESAILNTLEGHLRAILGTLTVEETYQDRKKFAILVREVAGNDVAKMGIQIISFVIKDISDNVGYLSALGKSRIAAAKRDAEIGIAYAERDAGIREAECEKESNSVRYQSLANIENYARLYHLQKADFDKEVNSAKAESGLAYELAEAKIKQQIRFEEIGIEIAVRKKIIEIEQKEIERKERELTGTIRLPTEAECYRLETIAEGKKTKVIQNAVGEAEKMKKTGDAEAYNMKLLGLIEADKMTRKALAYQMYGDTAIQNLILQRLPEIASHISCPLSKIDEIILLGGNNDLIKDINTLTDINKIPSSITGLDGSVNLKKLLVLDMVK